MRLVAEGRRLRSVTIPSERGAATRIRSTWALLRLHRELVVRRLAVRKVSAGQLATSHLLFLNRFARSVRWRAIRMRLVPAQNRLHSNCLPWSTFRTRAIPGARRLQSLFAERSTFHS